MCVSLAPFELLDSASWEDVSFKTFVLMAPVVFRGEHLTLWPARLSVGSRVFGVFSSDSFCFRLSAQVLCSTYKTVADATQLFQLVSWRGPLKFPFYIHQLRSISASLAFWVKNPTWTIVLAERWKSINVFPVFLLKSFSFSSENLYVLTLLIAFIFLFSYQSSSRG